MHLFNGTIRTQKGTHKNAIVFSTKPEAEGYVKSHGFSGNEPIHEVREITVFAVVLKSKPRKERKHGLIAT